MLGSLLKQIGFQAGGNAGGDIVGIQNRKNAIGGGGGGIVSTIFKNATEYLCRKAPVYAH